MLPLGTAFSVLRVDTLGFANGSAMHNPDLNLAMACIVYTPMGFFLFDKLSANLGSNFGGRVLRIDRRARGRMERHASARVVPCPPRREGIPRGPWWKASPEVRILN